jgi:hypothetical protein
MPGRNSTHSAVPALRRDRQPRRSGRPCRRRRLDSGTGGVVKDVVAMIAPISAMDKISKRLVGIWVSLIGANWFGMPIYDPSLASRRPSACQSVSFRCVSFPPIMRIFGPRLPPLLLVSTARRERPSTVSPSLFPQGPLSRRFQPECHCLLQRH